MLDALLLVVVLVTALVAGALSWRYPAMQWWFEKRMPVLAPTSMVRNFEAIACSRPINYFVINVMAQLGALSVASDVTGFNIAAVVRYTVSVVMASLALTLARRSAAMRPDQQGA